MTDWCRTYYVSQKHGNDQNSGRSSAEPYASLFAINRLKLQPGDRILLENNSVFAGQFLQITDSGTKDLPIVIGAYGIGRKQSRIRRLSQQTGRESGIRIMDASWILRHIPGMDMYRLRCCCMMQNM